MAGEQRPIHFGGVQLTELVSRYEESTPLAAIIEEHVYEPFDPKPGPAGEATRDARCVALSRWILAAKLKQGVPMKELMDHFLQLSIAEGLLIN
jgi:hypothetical protein